MDVNVSLGESNIEVELRRTALNVISCMLCLPSALTIAANPAVTAIPEADDHLSTCNKTIQKDHAERPQKRMLIVA
ncbi:hypothetical protein [Photobacterium arenosum]|uniref:hypothetical protein n=1 Tax=Photobacterium arenosum TaxID=2774143 RepID=UPI00288AF547|nr:hypothetical protein [Photobacterium arenosum]